MEQSTSNFPLKSPHYIILSATHPWGPLAGLLARKIYLPSAHFSLVNTGAEELVLTNLTVDPLERKSDGNSVEAEISICSKKGNVLPKVIQIKSEEVLDLQLHISGNLLPGNYLTNLRITGRNANQTLSIPIEVTIIAHWLWAISFMVLGLIFLGLIKFLAGVSDIQNGQKEILQLRQDVHEFLERYVPGDSEQKSVARIEEDMTRALEILNRPHRWALKDDRLQSAQKYKAHIEDQFKALQVQLEGKPEGAAELEALEKLRENLTKRIAEAKVLLSDQKNETPNSVDDWSVILQKYENVQRHAFLDLPIKAIEENLGHQVERVRLALASGEGPRARELATKVQGWFRQAAKILDERVHLVLIWRHFVSDMVLRQIFLSSLLQDPSFPSTEQNELAIRLEAARAVLVNNQSLMAFRQSHKKIQEAETFALKIRCNVIIAEVKDAMYAADRETSLELIGQALSKLTPGDAPEVKRQRAMAILDLWHQRVDSCKSLTLRKTLLDQVDSLKQLIEQGDLAATGPGFKRLLELWTGYQDTEINKARIKVERKFCKKLESELKIDLYSSEQGLALLEPNPRVKGVAEELDRVRLGLEQLPAGECLKNLTDLSGRLSKAGGKMMTALIAFQSISPEVRLSAAKRSGEKEAIALARRLMTGPRPIKVASLTPPDELYVDRQVTLELSDLDPSWGVGVNIIIDFGDGTPYAKFTAEQIRQGIRLTHRYKRPKLMEIHAIAAEDFMPGTLSPLGEMLGRGKAKLEILPSPIHAAQALADQFLNLRFILALTIGLLVQGWRFYGKHPFGIMNSDYIEAFALGVGIDASTQGLIEVLTKLGVST